MKHFKLRKDLSKEFFGKTLYRIEATANSKWAKKGDLGGYIEKESNLSGEAWVSDNALVYDNARVFGNAQVYGEARVYDDARVYGEAQVHGEAWISGNARVSGEARVYGEAQVYGNARVFGNAKVFGEAQVFGEVQVTKTPKIITGLKHNITLTETHIFTGCEDHTIEHWKKEIKNIGKKHNYTDKDIKQVIGLLKLLLRKL